MLSILIYNNDLAGTAGVVSSIAGYTFNGQLYKFRNIVILNSRIIYSSTFPKNSYYNAGILPQEYRPKLTIKCGATASSSTTSGAATIEITTDGYIKYYSSIDGICIDFCAVFIS